MAVEEELKASAQQFLEAAQEQRDINKRLLVAIESLLMGLRTPGDQAAAAAVNPPVPSGQVPEEETREFGEASGEDFNLPTVPKPGTKEMTKGTQRTVKDFSYNPLRWVVTVDRRE